MHNFCGRSWTGGRIRRWLIVLGGIILFQSILYGPALLGEKILLPLDLLPGSGWHIPGASAQAVPQDYILSDLIYQFEPARQFAVEELHHGRFPRWAPFLYAGVPYVWPKFSPFLLLGFATRSPVILAWVQLAAALVAGMGMYVFCRRSLAVGFWPAALCAWCYPLTAFFVLWSGFPTSMAVYWLPWMFWAVDAAVRRASGGSLIRLGLLTGLTLVSGHIDVAGQVLLGCGLYALWCLWDRTRLEPGRTLIRGLTVLVAGWGLGFMLAAPHILPLLEYARTGARMEHRSQGAEERPPGGLAALPQVVMPDMYGSTRRGSCFLAEGEPNLLESSSAAYVGILATLLVAPLAWFSRRHRSLNWFWVGLACLGLGWCLGIPGLVGLLRLPGLNMMSHNRLVFLTAFALLSLTAVGLENLLQGRVERSGWFWVPAATLAGLGLWCLYRSQCLPEPLASQIASALAKGPFRYGLATFRTAADLATVHAWFFRHYLATAVWCGLGFLGWLWVWFAPARGRGLVPLLGVLLAADLLWFDWGRGAQCDPSLYYPPIPVLQAVAQSTPGRVLGLNCLPASLACMTGLNDVRGYDSIDPARMVGLLQRAAQPGSNPYYASTQFLIPKARPVPPRNIQLHPILDLLGVRYVIMEGEPSDQFQLAWQGNGYMVLVNSNALPRVFVPQSVAVAEADASTLEKLARPQFMPAEVAYVPVPVNLPAAISGTAQIVHEIPTHIVVSVNMDTPGLVVLADRWDPGWRAQWNGQAADILQVDYALRGVVVPAGAGTLEFVYQPASLRWGLYLAGLAAVILLGLGALGRIRNPGRGGTAAPLGGGDAPVAA